MANAPKYKRRLGGYGPLKTPKGKTRKKYKTIDGYLRAVYRNNKEYLESHIDNLGDTRSKRQIFIDSVKELASERKPGTDRKRTIKEAIEKFQRSETVTTEMERIGETRLTKMREMDPENFKKFRKKVGWTAKLNSQNFVEMTHEGKFNYLRYYDPTTGKDVVIVEEISPKTGVTIKYDIMEFEEWSEAYTKAHKNENAKNQARMARYK